MPDMAVSGFVVNRQYVWLEAPETAVFAGFRAEVRQNLTNGERRLLIDQLAEIAEREKSQRDALRGDVESMQATIDKRRAANTPIDAAFVIELNSLTDKLTNIADAAQREAAALVLPHVRAWNAIEMDGEEAIPIPPPMEGGMASIDAITAEMGDWLCLALLSAYRSGKGVSSPSKRRADSPPPMGGPKRAKSGASGRNSHRPHQQSAGPSVSTFQA